MGRGNRCIGLARTMYTDRMYDLTHGNYPALNTICIPYICIWPILQVTNANMLTTRTHTQISCNSACVLTHAMRKVYLHKLQWV